MLSIETKKSSLLKGYSMNSAYCCLKFLSQQVQPAITNNFTGAIFPFTAGGVYSGVFLAGVGAAASSADRIKSLVEKHKGSSS